MHLLKSIITLTIMLIAVASYSQRIDSTDVMKYTLPSSFDLRKPAVNYTIVKPPQPGDSYAQQEHVIVRLKSAVGKKTSAGRIAIPQELEQQQQQFMFDLQRIENRANAGRTNAIASRIRYQYKRVFNGFALFTSRGVKEEIAKLEYVASVSEDKEVKMTDIVSSEIINAPKVWNDLNITGKGIKIGIIDTGIDYNHPDLGAGFGPSFKVIGGYDFINDDPDPIDDHGHGTHVAGIAAANGVGLKGVAPDAKLFAYKVLSSTGYGHDSGILAAIERTVDPDQNPGTDDALDVVNMSLGRLPDPQEPMSEAVDNAVAMGVTFVVAAGNSYDFLTVGTPGIAKNAITVGATDNSDVTAVFSSRGPVEKNFAIKPDVSAPGVEIFSSFKDGGYQSLNGTSMASPHVAGAVALILEKHPTWTPEIIKGALMGTAKKSTDLVWAQGSGRIDVFNAINADFIVTPGSFSLGKPDRSLSTWTKTIKAKVFNLTNSSKSFSMTVDGFANSAITTTITPSTFTLSANSSRDVDVKVVVNTSSLPILSFPELFSGDIVTTSSSKTMRSPIALVNPQVTKLQFTGNLPGLVIALGIEGTQLFKFVTPTSNEHLLYLPFGKYDFISQFPDNHFVITEGVQTDVDRTIPLSAEQAKNLIVFKPLDVQGNVIPIKPETPGIALLSGENRNMFTFFPYAEDTFYISDQNAYRYDMKINSTSPFDPDHYYEVGATTGTGITQSMNASNDPAQFLEMNITNPSAQQTQGLQFTIASNSGFTSWNTVPIAVPNPLKILSSKAAPGNQLNAAYVRLYPDREQPSYVWEAGIWRNVLGSNLVFQDKSASSLAEYSTSSFDYKLGESLLRFNGSMFNSTNRMTIMDPNYNGIFNRYHGERERGNVYYKLFDATQILNEGYFGNYIMTDISSSPNLILDLMEKPYRMNLLYEDYQVRGKFGRAEVDLYFDLSKDDKNPPHLRSLSLEVNGKSTDQILDNETGVLKIIADDYCRDPFGVDVCLSTGVSSISIQIKEQGVTEWITLSHTNNFETYQAELPADLPPGYYELKIEVADDTGNRSVSHLNPGFLVGGAGSSTPYANVILLAPKNKAIDAGVTPLFRWSEMPLASEYVIQIATTPDFDNTKIVDSQISLASFQAPVALDADKTYYWRVRANASVIYPWSTVHSFFTGTLLPPTLLEPLNNATQVSSENTRFKWTPVPNASAYFIEISHNEEMSDLVEAYFKTETIHTSNNLSSSTEFFWRVSAIYFSFDHTYYIPSAINRFTTGITTGVDDDVAYEFYSYPNPFTTQTRLVIVAKNSGLHTLSVRDAMGKQIRTLTIPVTPSEKTELVWDGKNDAGQHVSSGMYFVQLRNPAGVRNLKLMVQR